MMRCKKVEVKNGQTKVGLKEGKLVDVRAQSSTGGTGPLVASNESLLVLLTLLSRTPPPLMP